MHDARLRDPPGPHTMLRPINLSLNNPLVYKCQWILSGILVPIQLDHFQVATSPLFWVPCCFKLLKFTMRFIPFVIAGTAVTFCYTYAYAMPAKAVNNAGLSQADWCEGYSELTCSIRCSLIGYTHHVCTEEYVQVFIPSYKFNTWRWHINYSNCVCSKLSIWVFLLTPG